MKARTVVCHSCLADIVWEPDPQLFAFQDNGFRAVSLRPTMDPRLRRDERMRLYVRCPNQAAPDEHFLPACYFDHGEPLWIGMVGGSGAGKTHLLTAVIAALLTDAPRLGLEVEQLDPRRSAEFRERYLDLLDGTTILGGTATGAWEPTVSLLITGSGGVKRPVSFYDAAGGDLGDAMRTLEGTQMRVGQFLVKLNGLLFVQPLGDAREATPTQSVITTVLNRLADERTAAIPAAVAVTKCDRVRYEPVVEQWLHRPTVTGLDAALTRHESRDVFAFLHGRGEHAALEPYRRLDRCTLHFTSATGRDALNNRYARGVEPMRVLEPLLALFAMAGLIAGGDEVGT